MMSDATITTIVLSCNSLHVGHETFCVSSSHDSLKYSLIFLITLFARVERFELPSTVLETAILPLNYTRNWLGVEGSESGVKSDFLRTPDSPTLQNLFYNFNYLSCTNEIGRAHV